MRIKYITFFETRQDDGYDLFLLPTIVFAKDKSGWCLGICFLVWGIGIEATYETK